MIYIGNYGTITIRSPPDCDYVLVGFRRIGKSRNAMLSPVIDMRMRKCTEDEAKRFIMRFVEVFSL